MSGFIKKREVIKCSLTVVKLYGVRVYIACLTAKNGTTFLDILMKHGRI
jgi:hypothetical protein